MRIQDISIWSIILTFIGSTVAFHRLPIRHSNNNNNSNKNKASWPPPLPELPNEIVREYTVGHIAMDPKSEQAVNIVRNNLGLSSTQHDQLETLTDLVLKWNANINLVSRKNCTREVIFGRHILPSLAPLGMSPETAVIPKYAAATTLNDDDDDDDIPFQVADVGTGGGFPGLPLAIAYPHCEFVLIDSTQKKLAAIQAMVEQLELTNVRTLHARAPHDFVIDDPTATSVASLSNALPLSSLSASSSPLDLPLHSLQKYSFDVCVGRSVAAVPTFCFWILPLLKKETGRLLYMTGGDIPSDWSQCALQKPTVPFLLLQSNEKPNIPITAINEMAATTSTNEDSSSSSIIEKSRLEKNSPTTQEEELYYDEINNAEDEMGSSEKRVLVFSHSTVVSLAETSGEKLRLPNPTRKRRPPRPNNNNNNAFVRRGGKKLARGAWARRDDKTPKKRGYENFKRYDSTRTETPY